MTIALQKRHSSVKCNNVGIRIKYFTYIGFSSTWPGIQFGDWIWYYYLIMRVPYKIFRL